MLCLRDGYFDSYNLSTGMCTSLDLDGNPLGDPRPISEAERREVDPGYLAEQVDSLTAALDQLILDALMGGM